MDYDILYGMTIADLKSKIKNVLSANKATNITSISLSVYNGLFYCAIIFNKSEVKK